MSLPDPVAEHARLRGDAFAVETPGYAWTWRAADEFVDAAAPRLQRLADGRGVAVQAPPSPTVVVLVWAALRAGVTLVPLSPRWPPAAVGKTLARLGVRRLVTDGEPPAGVEAVGLDALIEPDDVEPRAAATLDPERPFTVVHTSGSTGTPKAALHTLANHVASARGVIERLDLRPGDRWWLDLPLEHVGGLGVVVRCALAGAAVALPDRGLSLAENLDALRPTHASLVPTQLGRWLDAADVGADVSSLRAVLVGGAATPPELLDRALEAGLPVCTSWGMTEMTATVTATAPGAGRHALATAGAPLAGREVRIDAPDSGSGEIWVRGASRFQGYLRGALGGPLAEPFDADGWFATGDLGRFDAAGRLVVTGRADLQFVSGGENVQPEAIERVLRAVDGVAEAVVVPVPSATFGARPVAFVRPAAVGIGDRDALPVALVAAVDAAVRAALPGFMVPDAFYVWSGTDGLKPDRPALTREAERRAAGRMREGGV